MIVTRSGDGFMNKTLKTLVVAGTTALTILFYSFPGLGRAGEKPALTPKSGWTLEQAKAELALNPRDAYLQYVVLQLARRDKKLDETIEWLEPKRDLFQMSSDATPSPVDLFSIFTGALAIQESLQLESMGGGARRGNGALSPDEALSREDRDKANAALEKRRKEMVEIA